MNPDKYEYKDEYITGEHGWEHDQDGWGSLTNTPTRPAATLESLAVRRTGLLRELAEVQTKIKAMEGVQ
jgi:hypothetical protein